MTFENEMDQFFARNCYSEKERLRVRECLAYRRAAESHDATQAQETATRILEGSLEDSLGASSPRYNQRGRRRQDPVSRFAEDNLSPFSTV
jgi:hypothetical protein